MADRGKKSMRRSIRSDRSRSGSLYHTARKGRFHIRRPRYGIFQQCSPGINSAVQVLQTLVVALGAGLGIWGAINLMEGYGNDNPGAKSQGMKQLMAGGGVALIGITLVPLLSGLFG